ncbi:quinone oxidoreductase family protein [Pollutimonas harenae]|uniref:Quinone oxidoreductase n=1 Tax=Pollutimonas harenae TaxID=657015 RepID=A0A853H1J3_9BURK|nr:quinone oxidoreductase [Pollutimonas harenae]NYT84443.1 quinone oxidoreductase [Pollutimonas harenae]TEA73156.1 quinone oxidoreductase [Pollutimonas harenae]
MTTQAYAIRIHEYGGPENMVYEAVDVAEPAAGEVQIRQHAIGVNYLDTYNRRGVFPVPELPWGLGVEGAGVVTAVGKGVSHFAIGDRVAYASRPIGSYATVRNLPVDLLLHLHDDVSFEQAAAVTLQGLTAHMLVNRVTHLQAGDTALVHAAAGGLGLLLVQWLKHKGCRVIGTVGSEAKAALAREHGCDDLILYNDESFTDGVRRLTDGKGVDAVFEGLGGQVFHDSLTILKPFGQLVNLGQVAEGLPAVDLSALGPVRSLTVSVPGVFAYMTHHPNLQGAADTLFGMVARGELRVHIGQQFALSETAQAHQALQERKTTGSVVLIPN